MKKGAATNKEIADTLDHVADLLEVEKNNAFRVRSYRNAAATVRRLDTPVSTLLQEDGHGRLKSLPGVGDKLAGAIEEIAMTGRFPLEDHLESKVWPGKLFTKVPGIGTELAHRIHEQLGISTLEELEVAAHDGRLERVEGIGPERAEGVRVALAGMLSRSSRRQLRQATEQEAAPGENRPSVDLLLDVDREYRTKADRGRLHTIAPKRFNPEGEAWLPVLTTRREDWEFTALYSNTALAHEAGRTHDWVVIYYEKAGRQQQCTVVTNEKGPLKGKRVVRGRERECRQHYGL